MNSPAEIAQNYIAIGAAKTRTSAWRLLILGIFAGIFIALAGVGATIASATVENASLAKLLGAMVFPGGLLMVILAGSELFTGNCLIIISVLSGEATWGGLLRNWLLVYLGNFLGSLLVAALAVLGRTYDLFGAGAAAAMLSAAAGKVSLTFGSAFFRGILCNILVCIAVWSAFAAKTAGGKLAAVYLPVLIFVLCGFEHSVANMYYIAAAIFGAGNSTWTAVWGGDPSVFTWGAFLLKNLLPVTLGNIVGGAGLVGCGYWLAYLKKDRRAGK